MVSVGTATVWVTFVADHYNYVPMQTAIFSGVSRTPEHFPRIQESVPESVASAIEAHVQGVPGASLLPGVCSASLR